MKPPRETRVRAKSADAAQYKEVSGLLTVALVMFPIPAILILLCGDYAPRVKLFWAITAAVESAAMCVLFLVTLYHLRTAFALL